MQKFVELEKQGKLKPGTTKTWAEETPNIHKLPEKVAKFSAKIKYAKTVKVIK